MTASGTDLCRLIERARRQEPGALDRLLESYRNYLRLLARCLADFVRRYRAPGRRAGREESLDRLLGRSSAALGRVPAADGTSPSAAAARRDLGVVLADALAELSAEHREVIVLHHLEGLGWDEVARRMGRTPNAVRKLWARALGQMRPLIDERL